MLRAEKGEEKPASQPYMEAFLEEGEYRQIRRDTGQVSLCEKAMTSILVITIDRKLVPHSPPPKFRR